MPQQQIDHGTTVGDGTGEPIFFSFEKANSNFDELYAADAAEAIARAEADTAEVTARNSAISTAVQDAKVNDGEYTEAGVLVWPANTSQTFTHSSPGVVSTIVTSHNGKTYTMTFIGTPVTTVTVSDGTTTWTKTYTYAAGVLTGVSHWAEA